MNYLKPKKKGHLYINIRVGMTVLSLVAILGIFGIFHGMSKGTVVNNYQEVKK